MARQADTARRAEPHGHPLGRLKTEAIGLVDAFGERAISSVREKVAGTVGRLTDYAETGGPGLAAALTGAKDLAEGESPARSLIDAGLKGAGLKGAGLKGAGLKGAGRKLFGRGKGGGGGERKLKLTNIVESIDVGVPVGVAYDQWTRFTDFPAFMKKVESVEQEDDPKVRWRAQILWSHRTWESTILEQEPDSRIIWRSEGQKGHVDGAVTFHELGPDLTRILLVMEYHPQGFFEYTGNLWRAQGRRTRLELKHFQRHVMVHALQHPDEVQGWRGVIQEGKVVEDSASEDSASEDSYEEEEQ